ncbi:MAG: hypothetical protein GWN87_03635, partial [Desulfuromonadales bacterium]|nr:hypothetical protein [Desulfuromonadales bacterium]
GSRRGYPDLTHHGQVCNNVRGLVKLDVRAFLVVEVFEALQGLQGQCRAALILEVERSLAI